MNADKAKQEINALIDAALDAMPPSGRESTEIDIHVPIRALREILDALPKQPTTTEDEREGLVGEIFKHAGKPMRGEGGVDTGGLICSCSEWESPRQDDGIRPWAAWYQHVADAVLEWMRAQRPSNGASAELADAVRSLHPPMDSCSLAANGEIAQRFVICSTCEVRYPCPTIEVLDALPKQPTSNDRDELRVVITKALYGLSETAQVVTDAVIDWMSARRSSQLAVEHNDDLAMVLYDLAGGAIDYHGATILANRARIHIGSVAQVGGES